MTTTGGYVGGGIGLAGGITAGILLTLPGINVLTVASLALLGGSVGLSLGTMVDPAKAEIDKQRLLRDKLQTTTSQRNITIPVSYGVNLHPGNLILIAKQSTEPRVVGSTTI